MFTGEKRTRIVGLIHLPTFGRIPGQPLKCAKFGIIHCRTIRASRTCHECSCRQAWTRNYVMTISPLSRSRYVLSVSVSRLFYRHRFAVFFLLECKMMPIQQITHHFDQMVEKLGIRSPRDIHSSHRHCQVGMDLRLYPLNEWTPVAPKAFGCCSFAHHGRFVVGHICHSLHRPI